MFFFRLCLYIVVLYKFRFQFAVNFSLQNQQVYQFQKSNYSRFFSDYLGLNAFCLCISQIYKLNYSIRNPFYAAVILFNSKKPLTTLQTVANSKRLSQLAVSYDSPIILDNYVLAGSLIPPLLAISLQLLKRDGALHRVVSLSRSHTCSSLTLRGVTIACP